MKTYEIKIQEKTTYWQSGTVLVTAKNATEAKKLALKGEYEHTGDNEINLDTEGEILEREIDNVTLLID